ncbi:MAG: hypothetical protein ACI4NG_03410 [Candidatus Gallimonas sp.]
MRSNEYLSEIRKSAGLVRAVLQKIVANNGTATFCLATDVRYTPEDEAYAREVSARFVPEGFRAEVRIVKSVPDAETVKKRILELLGTKFPAAAAFVSPQDVEVIKDDVGGRFFLDVGTTEKGRFSSGEILDALNAELQRCFCGSWFGNVRAVEKAAPTIEKAPIAPAEYVFAPRFFPVTAYEAIDGAKPERAIYLADLTDEGTGITVCGTVNFVAERETSKGKPYFSFTISDGSSQARIYYFSKKSDGGKGAADQAGRRDLSDGRQRKL